MSVMSMSKKNLPKIDHKIGHGASSISYKTTDGLVLKEYINNKIYQRLLKEHDNDFLAYLVELSKIDNPILVTPQDIFVTRNLVAAQTYPYQAGTTIDKMYPKTDINKFIEALDTFFIELTKIDYLKLRDIHYHNMLYTGIITLIDLDFCLFQDGTNLPKDNLSHVNEYLLKGIFNLSVDKDIVVDSLLSELLDSSLNGEIPITEFLRKYQSMIIESRGKCKYVKQLTKDFIREDIIWK